MDKAIFEIGRRFSLAVREKLDPESILLYGSYSRDEQTEESDIDIAIIFKDFSGDEWAVSRSLWAAAWEIDSRIEPILLDMHNDPSGFCEHVMLTGIEL